MPRVSVVMAFYNAAPYLVQAVESVLAQTYRDFELIMVDDGSEDHSLEIACYLAEQDHRILILENGKNLGLSQSLNIGIANSSGELISRMDADDYCLPQKLEKQVNALDLHPEIGALGTQAQRIDEEGKYIGDAVVALDDLVLRWKCIFVSPFLHPTVLMRKSLLETIDGPYQLSTSIEDYILFSQLIRKTKFANLPDVLFKYRVHNKSKSMKAKEEMARDQSNASIEYIHRELPDCLIAEERIDALIKYYHYPPLINSTNQSGADFAITLLDLFRIFAHKYQNKPEISLVRKIVSEQALLLSVSPLFQRHMFAALASLTRITPGWPLCLGKLAGGKIVRKLTNRSRSD